MSQSILFIFLHITQFKCCVLQNAPFEVSKVNIRMLESIFDPSVGATIKATDLVMWLLKILQV